MSSWAPAGNLSISRRQESYHSADVLNDTIPCCIRPCSGRARANLSVIGLSTFVEGYICRSLMRFFNRASIAR